MINNGAIYYYAYEKGDVGEWAKYRNKLYFGLSKEEGIKSVTLKVRRDNCESEEKSASIRYSPKKYGGKKEYNNSENIRIYPNPVYDNLFVEYFTNNQVYIKIINIAGGIMYQNKFNDKINVDISKFGKGIYFIEIIENNVIHSKKFIKK